MERMRVALVYHFFAHYRKPVLEELLISSVHQWVMYGDAKDVDGAGIEVWVPEYADTFVRTPCRRIYGFLLQRGLVNLALRKDIDCVVYLGDWHFITTWVSAILARISGKRVLFWTHGWLRDETGILGRARVAFYRIAHGLLLYGYCAKARGIARGMPPESLYVIYNSLDYQSQVALRDKISEEELASVRESLFGSRSLPVVVCTARLIRAKRIDQLIDAAALLRENGHPVNLLFVGDGPERASLEERAKSLEVTMCLYGPCYDEPVLARLIMCANVTVIPGAAGLTIMHSLCYGTPVLTHNDPTRHGPEFEAVIPGVNGDTYSEGDVSALADLIAVWTTKAEAVGERRQRCRRVIDLFYNPELQRRAIDRAVAGLPANDFFWSKEDAK
jgi:glycosyltransferase involved in cell wall biosynthesis